MESFATHAVFVPTVLSVAVGFCHLFSRFIIAAARRSTKARRELRCVAMRSAEIAYSRQTQ